MSLSLHSLQMMLPSGSDPAQPLDFAGQSSYDPSAERSNEATKATMSYLIRYDPFSINIMVEEFH